MSSLHRERNEIAAARELLARSEELGELNGLPQNRYRWRVAMARILEAEGDLSAAVDFLNEADRAYVGDFSPNVRPVPAVRARAWIAQGRSADALSWARDVGLSVDDELSYVHEFEHVTLARALLASHESERNDGFLDDATVLLERLLEAAQEGERAGTVIEILALQSLAQQARGDLPAAHAALQRALTLAEPEGYVRVFVDEGPVMASLLRSAVKQGGAASYPRRLLIAFATTEDTATLPQGLIDPLSERELDVLRLLASDLSGPTSRASSSSRSTPYELTPRTSSPSSA